MTGSRLTRRCLRSCGVDLGTPAALQAPEGRRQTYTVAVPPAPLPSELVEFLKGPHAAVVSTVRSDGAPYSAATWYDWEDGRILLNMDAERLRLTHMRRDPRVAVTVVDLGDWYRAVTVLGRVVELRDDEALVDIDRLSQRYRGTPYKNRERPRVTALVEPERWHDHS
jgi:PPOX class probable F420-dependent enzyme